MLILLIFTKILSSVLSEDSYKITATALYYTDTKGRLLLVTGPLPSDTNHTIQDDIESRFLGKKPFPIDVVPVFKGIEDIPLKQNVIKLLKRRFSSVYVANIPKAKSKNIINDMRKYMTPDPFQKYFKREGKTFQNYDEYYEPTASPVVHPKTWATVKQKRTRSPNSGLKSTLNFSYIQLETISTMLPIHDNLGETPDGLTRPFTTNFSYIPGGGNVYTKKYYSPRPFTTSHVLQTKKRTRFQGTPPSSKAAWSQEEFIPNDIYYGIEKSCANWNNLCSLKGPRPAEIPANYISIPKNILKPPILHWIP